MLVSVWASVLSPDAALLPESGKESVLLGFIVDSVRTSAIVLSSAIVSGEAGCMSFCAGVISLRDWALSAATGFPVGLGCLPSAAVACGDTSTLPEGAAGSFFGFDSCLLAWEPSLRDLRRRVDSRSIFPSTFNPGIDGDWESSVKLFFSLRAVSWSCR